MRGKSYEKQFVLLLHNSFMMHPMVVAFFAELIPRAFSFAEVRVVLAHEFSTSNKRKKRLLCEIFGSLQLRLQI